MESGTDALETTGTPAAADPGELSIAGQYLTRLLAVATLAALGMLAVIAWQVQSSGRQFDFTGLTTTTFLVGVFWLATAVCSLWRVRLEWSGASLGIVTAGLGLVGVVLRTAVPPSESSRYMGFGAGELASALRFSLVCAGVLFVLWAVWTTMSVARRRWPRVAIAALGAGLVALLVLAWIAVPIYPAYYGD